jgi:hypothetical protein
MRARTPRRRDVGNVPSDGVVSAAVAADHAQCRSRQIGDALVAAAAIRPDRSADTCSSNRPVHVPVGLEGPQLIAVDRSEIEAVGGPRRLPVAVEQALRSVALDHPGTLGGVDEQA